MSNSISAVSNVKWAAASQIGRVAIQLTSLVIIARLLPASDFGLLAMANVVTNFAMIIRDMGTGAAVIQTAVLSDKLLDTVFWSNAAFGVFAGALVALGSPFIAWIFREPALGSILLLLSIAFPIGALGTTQLSLLERGGFFRTIAGVEIGSAFVGAAGGIFAAWRGAGIMSLIGQTLITTILSGCCYWLLSRWRPKFRWSRGEFTGLLQFSGNLVSFNIVNYFSRNADAMIIGRILGPSELGFYNMAYRIMLFPLQNLTLVLNRAFFPIFSSKQQDKRSIGRNYLKLLKMINLLTAPLMLGIWAVRDPFIIITLGPNWKDSAGIIAWLAPTGYLQSLASTGGTILMALGKTKLLRNVGLVCSLLYLSSFFLGARFGAAGVAEAYFLPTLSLLQLALVSRFLRSNLRLLTSLEVWPALWSAPCLWPQCSLCRKKYGSQRWHLFLRLPSLFPVAWLSMLSSL
ncbi:lipopolysaccharide biosynthesis protein [Bradyrhizobium sp. RDM12]